MWVDPRKKCNFTLKLIYPKRFNIPSGIFWPRNYSEYNHDIVEACNFSGYFLQRYYGEGFETIQYLYFNKGKFIDYGSLK